MYKLSAKAVSLELVDREMKQRFPSKGHFSYFYEGNQVKDLQTVFNILQKKGQTSLKLTAKNEFSKIEEASKEESNFEIQSLKEELPSFVQDCSIQSISEVSQECKQDLPSEFYICYECLGKGQVIESSRIHLCTICKGKGKLNQNHKYVQRLQELFLKKVEPVENKKEESMFEEMKIEEPKRKNSIGEYDKNYDVIVSEMTKREKAPLNKLFTMRFEIKNVGKDWKQKEIQVIECGKTQGKRVSALTSGDKMMVDVGPFICKDESALEKTYSLFYKDGEDLVRFGHKFGFSVRGAKRADIFKNDSVEREKEKLKELKSVSGSSKSEEFLGLKLKSLGIDLLNLELDEESLIEIVKQIK